MHSNGLLKTMIEPITKTIDIHAAPEIVFEYLTRREKIMLWMGIDAVVDPRPGGTFQIAPNRFDRIRGEYIEATPFSKVAFTWGLDGEGHGFPAGSSLVEISLTPIATGTHLQLVHSKFPDNDWRDPHDGGWDFYLARIAAAAEGHPLGPDPNADVTESIVS